jgi:hypothetical protein
MGKRVSVGVGPDEGPKVSYNGRLTIALAHDPLRGWRVVVGIEPYSDVPAGAWVTSDFAPSDVADIVAGLEAAVADARARLT